MGNNPVRYVDPDGRAAWQIFKTMDEAAEDFAISYNDDSIRNEIEIGTLIHVTRDNKFYYETPYTDNEKQRVQHTIDSKDKTIVAIVHTHGSYGSRMLSEFFSFGEENSDLANAQKSNLVSYLVTPGGKLLKYIPTGDYYWNSVGIIESIENKLIPSDVNAKERRRTNVDANLGKKDHYKVRK